MWVESLAKASQPNHMRKTRTPTFFATNIHWLKFNLLWSSSLQLNCDLFLTFFKSPLTLCAGKGQLVDNKLENLQKNRLTREEIVVYLVKRCRRLQRKLGRLRKGNLELIRCAIPIRTSFNVALFYRHPDDVASDC